MRSTRGDIINQALQRVGNNSASLVAQARFRLNRILQELYQGWDWPFLWRMSNVTILRNGILDLTLIDGFVKPEDDQSLMVLSTAGQPLQAVVTEVDHRTFYMNVHQSTSEGTVPRFWTIDYSGPTGRTWPQTVEDCIATLRYKFLPPDVSLADATVYDADIPVFPWDTTLSDLLFEWAMSYEVDPRRGDQYQVNAESIARSRGGSFPERSYPSTVQLDPTVFSRPWQGNS